MGLPCQEGTRPEADNTPNKKLNEVSPLAARFQKMPYCITVTGSNFISVREIVHGGKQKITVEWEIAKEAETCVSGEGRIPVTYQFAVPKEYCHRSGLTTELSTNEQCNLKGRSTTLRLPAMSKETDGQTDDSVAINLLPIVFPAIRHTAASFFFLISA
jgi:hypothetical protein